MVIIFNVPEARNQLLENGIVYTYRWTPRKKTGDDWANSKRCTKKIADVYIEDYGETRCDEETLLPFAAESGFNDVNAWIKKILEKANPNGNIHGHLYKVTQRSKGERTG